MYSKIINPLTGRKVSISGTIGKKVLSKYINLSGGSSRNQESPKIKYQLITDVDDTLYPAGVLAPIAGKDKRGYRKLYYPCVKKIHRSVHSIYRLPTVIVSANPFNPSKKKIIHKTEALHGLGKKDDVIYYSGAMKSSLSSVFWGLLGSKDAYMAMALVKINTIKTHIINQNREALENNHEIRYIWIGDNGQGDLLVANELLREGIIYAAFIHTVDENKPIGDEDEIPNLFPFPTYKHAIQNMKMLNILPKSWSCNDPTFHAPILARQISQQEREK